MAKLKAEILVEVQAIFEECTGVEWGEVKPADDLREDVGMDELEFEELSVEIDDRLGVELEEGWYSEVKTMGQLMEYLEKNLAA
jgi:acyl carrier protein